MRPSLDSAAAACADALAALEQAWQAHLEAQRAERLARERAEAAGRALDRASATRWLVENLAAHPTPAGGHEFVHSDQKTRTITTLESRTEAGSLRITHEEWRYGLARPRITKSVVRPGARAHDLWCRNLNIPSERPCSSTASASSS